MQNQSIVLSIALYTFGNSKSPRLPRLNTDIYVEDGLVKPTHPPTGASTFADIKFTSLTGHYYKLEKGIELPSGLNVIADAKDAE